MVGKNDGGSTSSKFELLLKKIDKRLNVGPYPALKKILENGGTFGKGLLESVTSPYTSEVGGENGKKRLKISFACDALPKDSETLSSYLDTTMTDCKQDIRKEYEGLELTLEQKEPDIGEIRRNLTLKYRNRGTLDELFSVEYLYSTISKNGEFNVYISEKLAKKVDLAARLFGAVWTDVVLDSNRLSNLLFDNADLIVTKVVNTGPWRSGPDQGKTDNDGDYEDKETIDGLGLNVQKGRENFTFVGGYAELKEEIKRDALYPLLYLKEYKKVTQKTRVHDESSTSNALLFYGPPGTGKTLMARAIANEEKINLIYLNLSRVFSMWMGQSAERLTDAFDYVEKYSQKHGKTILFIDEIDSIGGRSEGNQAADLDDRRVVNVFLTRLDGFNSKKEDSNLILVGSTNHYSILDPAIRSRFGNEIYFPLPSKEDRKEIIKLYAKQLSQKEIERLAESTDQLAGRDINNIAKAAERRLTKERIEKTTDLETPPFNYYEDALVKIRNKTKRAPVPENLYS